MRLGNQTSIDAVRMAVQTVAAVVASYLIMRWLGFPNVSWAVISALFVIQLSADQTLTLAIGRVIGTIIGSLIGLACVFLISGADYMLIRLAVGCACMSALATYRPNWTYGIVATAIIAMEPEPIVVDGALGRAIAISLGAIIGAVAALAVWPEFGRRRTLRFLRQALADCRDLLRIMLKDVEDGERRKYDELRWRFLQNLSNGRSSAWQSRIRPHLVNGVMLSDVIAAAERLWHAIIIIDRVATDRRADLELEDLAGIRPQVDEVQRTACEHLDNVVGYLEGKAPNPPDDDLHVRIDEAEAAARRNLAARSTKRSEVREEAMQALVFGLGELGRNLREFDLLLRKASTA